MSTRARRSRSYAAAGAVLLIAGVTALVVGVRAQQQAPRPSPGAARPVEVIPTSANSRTTPSGSGSPGRSAAHTRGLILARSAPVHLDIPAINVSSEIERLGLERDGSVQVPPLGADSHAGWYKYSPAPGQLGPSILLGHIDSKAYGPGVFFLLGDLRQRDTISVTLANQTVAVFAVERVVEYPKAHFPTLQVYGNVDHAGLRLITCGGTFDPSKQSYEDNIVAYASLISSHPA